MGLTARWLIGTPDGGFITEASLKYFLGVSGDGTFTFLQPAHRSRYGGSWIMPSTLFMRPGPESWFTGALLFFFEPSNPPHGALAYAAPAAGLVAEYTGPALLPDGTVVWAPTANRLVAVCPDGRTRWVLDFFNSGRSGRGPHIFAAGDGTIILAAASLHRIDGDGRVLASRDASDLAGAAVAFSDRCGVAIPTTDARTMRGVDVTLLSGFDFSTVRRLPANAVPTNDCGWWGDGPLPAGGPNGRYRPDGTLGFAAPDLPFSLARIELTDGSWLMVDRGGAAERPPRMSIVADDGAIIFDREFEPAVLGEVLTPGAFLLTPNGVLYVTATSGFEAVQRIAAIEVGIGPAAMWAPTINGTQGSGNWARDGATWHNTVVP